MYAIVSNLIICIQAGIQTVVDKPVPECGHVYEGVWYSRNVICNIAKFQYSATCHWGFVSGLIILNKNVFKLLFNLYKS